VASLKLRAKDKFFLCMNFLLGLTKELTLVLPLAVLILEVSFSPVDDIVIGMVFLNELLPLLFVILIC
jgi:hypothetical protein